MLEQNTVATKFLIVFYLMICACLICMFVALHVCKLIVDWSHSVANFIVFLAPRIIQNVTVKTNATHAEIRWDAQDDGPMLKIDFK